MTDYKFWTSAAVLFAGGFFFWLLIEISPAASSADIRQFRIYKSESLTQVADNLFQKGLIRSKLAFKIMGVASRSSARLQAGPYLMTPSSSSIAILRQILSGPKTVRVTVPEGLSIYETDRLLSQAGVLKSGELAALGISKDLEGRLYPDTYDFFIPSKTDEVADKFLENFDWKAAPILREDEKKARENLIIASYLEREVPEISDMEIVAGILKKRLKAGMRLQVDATICYIKKMRISPEAGEGCGLLSRLDFQIKSPYNTYLYGGLTPGPIGSPGTAAIRAAINPRETPYWYYLSDPATKKTVFSKTYEEQTANRAKYLNI